MNRCISWAVQPSERLHAGPACWCSPDFMFLCKLNQTDETVHMCIGPAGLLASIFIFTPFMNVFGCCTFVLVVFLPSTPRCSRRHRTNHRSPCLRPLCVCVHACPKPQALRSDRLQIIVTVRRRKYINSESLRRTAAEPPPR